MSNQSIHSIISVAKEDLSTQTNHQSSVTNSDKFSSYLDDVTNKTVSLESIFQRAADKYNVDVNLLKAIAKAESAFNPNVTSHAGAMGIMQLMPATAKSLGVKDAYDPEQNIMGGAKLISQLLKQYNGNTQLALAAYNAGSGNVKKYGGIPPFKETQNYVIKVQKYYKEGVAIPSDKQNVSATNSNRTAAFTTNPAPYSTSTSNLDVLNEPTKDSAIINIHPMLEASLNAMDAQDKLLDSLQKMLTDFGNSEDNAYSYDEYSRFLRIYLDSIALNTSSKEDNESDYKNYLDIMRRI